MAPIFGTPKKYQTYKIDKNNNKIVRNPLK